MAFGPGSVVSDYRCRNHPERDGVGICVRCRRVVCVECSTKVDQMNFCTACLAAISAAPARAGRPEASVGPVKGVLFLILSYLALVGLFTLFGLLIATLASFLRQP